MGMFINFHYANANRPFPRIFRTANKITHTVLFFSLLADKFATERVYVSWWYLFLQRRKVSTGISLTNSVGFCVWFCVHVRIEFAIYARNIHSTVRVFFFCFISSQLCEINEIVAIVQVQQCDLCIIILQLTHPKRYLWIRVNTRKGDYLEVQTGCIRQKDTAMPVMMWKPICLAPLRRPSKTLWATHKFRQEPFIET